MLTIFRSVKNRWPMIFSLLFATLIRTFLVIISYGCKVPAGIFVPSMAIGASFGRMVGILVQAMHEAFPHARFFSACEPDVPCITPGTYAFLGAAAALSGIMHITVTVVVIMFELTGALTYILPTMIVVGVTKAVGERFGKGGIADRMIWFNGFPFLDNKEEHSFGVPVSQVMTHEITSLPSTGLNIRNLEEILAQNKYQGFPIIDAQNLSNKILLGYIGRTELRYAIDRAKKESFVSSSAMCLFSQPDSSTALQTPSAAPPPVTFDAIESSSGSHQRVDFSRFIDPTPLTVHPRLPLETVMELFKKMGPRVILVDYRGRLAGLVTVKDCLKYQFKVEAHETAGGSEHPEMSERQERLWGWIKTAGEWVRDRVGAWTGGRIKLGTSSGRRRGERSGHRRSTHTTGAQGSGLGSGGSSTGGRHSADTDEGAILLGEEESADPRDRLEPITGATTSRSQSQSQSQSQSRFAILDGTEDDLGTPPGSGGSGSGSRGVELRDQR